jgi:hypothetical protein
MRRAALTSAAAVAIVPIALTTQTAATDWASGGCGPATVGGATVVTYCGPAKATVKLGGKTYRFSGGKCSLTRAAGITAWTILLGRQTLPPAKPKFSSFQASIYGKPKAGMYRGSDVTLSFEIPGKAWVLAIGLPHKMTATAGAKRGTFSGKLGPVGGKGFRFGTGSWTC